MKFPIAERWMLAIRACPNRVVSEIFHVLYNYMYTLAGIEMNNGVSKMIESRVIEIRCIDVGSSTLG